MRILVTGGAGFIGSNLVDGLLKDERVSFVRVLDDLSTGFERNIKEHYDRPDFEFVKGDIRDYDVCMNACKGMNAISHQAALGSVPRSINDPIKTNSVNIDGFLNMMTAAKESGIKRFVFAASSSTYGDSKELPKKEERIGAPLSPYAVTKLVNELYANVFSRVYGVEYVGLRYFNVFGPKQDPNGAYAAVIPLFMKAALNNTAPTINGDGTFSRDFTYVKNAVQANIKALFTENNDALNQIYNVALGERTTLNELWQSIRNAAKCEADAIHGPVRGGDIPHSLADISKAKSLLGYDPKIKIDEGLGYAYDWYFKFVKGGK